MKRKKLKFITIGSNEELSRNDMKDIMAGSGGGDCVYCETTGSPCSGCNFECWHRDDTENNAYSICSSIYPSCFIEKAYWGACSGCNG